MGGDRGLPARDGRPPHRAGPDGKEAVAGWNRELLVLEEVNQFSEMCDDFWEDLPEEDEDFRGTELWKPKQAKKTPPRVAARQGGRLGGRARSRCTCSSTGRTSRPTVLKGVRNSLGMRLLGGYQPQQWKVLVGTTPDPGGARTTRAGGAW